MLKTLFCKQRAVKRFLWGTWKRS